MAGNDAKSLKVVEIRAILEGTWPIAHSPPQKPLFYYYLNEVMARISRRGRISFDVGRDMHVDRGDAAQ
jgi:hypothetical protein